VPGIAPSQSKVCAWVDAFRARKKRCPLVRELRDAFCAGRCDPTEETISLVWDTPYVSFVRELDEDDAANGLDWYAAEDHVTVDPDWREKAWGKWPA